MQLIVYPTNRCNLRCKHCTVNKDFPVDLTDQDIDIIASWGITKVGILGGEPYMLGDRLPKIVDKFNVPVTIYTNGTLVNDDNVIPDVNYCVSIDGWREYHDYLRGEGIFQKAITALELLHNHLDEIKSLWIRMTYNNDNWRDIGKLYNKAQSLGGVNLLLHPEVGIGLKPLDGDVQLELFKFAASHDNVVILQPHFWQFCGYEKSTCPAGIYRLAVDEHGNVKPCQWITETIGNIHTDTYEELLEKGRNWHYDYGSYIEPSCTFCDRKDSCRSGCRMCSDTQTCPLRNSVSASTFYSGNELKKINIKHSPLSKVGIVGC